MVVPAPPDLLARIAALEAEVRSLRERVTLLERLTSPRMEHPLDRDAVTEKSTFDWQGPR
jgi:hypothetical protein